MQFNSIAFAIVFPIAVLLYRLIPQKFRYVWLFVASAAFYCSHSGSLILLVFSSVVITYITGIAIPKASSNKAKKAILICALVVSLAVLFVYKYLGFTAGLLGSDVKFDIVMPLGISFYTFSALSYMIDVYKEKIQPERNIIKLAMYLMFFLSIVSGPINRAGDIIPQFDKESLPDLDKIKTGMQKMLWGYFLKLAIAGRLAIAVDNVYADPGAHTGFEVAVAALFYMFMLYCDFEGYSQIAIGGGYILGIDMKENFRQPFFATSMSDVWRRWHVSLSTWFRDYLYIPLGGSRCSKMRKYINLLIVLFVSGIWHGANLTFFAWGLLNGIFIVVGQILLPYRDSLASRIKEKCCKSDKGRKSFDSFRIILQRTGVYILFSYVFIYFANDSIANAYLSVKAILTRFSFSGAYGAITSLGLGRFNLALTLMMILFVMIADGAANKRSCDTPSLIKNIPAVLRWVIYYALVTAILFSANLSGKEFIYSKM